MLINQFILSCIDIYFINKPRIQTGATFTGTYKYEGAVLIGNDRSNRFKIRKRMGDLARAGINGGNKIISRANGINYKIIQRFIQTLTGPKGISLV